MHCHHVEHWSHGGETSLDNLMLLCTKHHTLVHEGGFRIEKDFHTIREIR
ncbi:MAG TPA: HNH endonuclease signature motif containing protein [Gammaproteobacteria bacterium]